MFASTVSFWAQHVVDLLVDRGEVVLDLVHGQLHRLLRHERPDAGQHRRAGQVGQERSWCCHDLEVLGEVAVLRFRYGVEAACLRVLYQRELLRNGSGILGQLHPAAPVGGDLGTCLHGGARSTEGRSEPVQSQVPRRHSPGRQEAPGNRRAVPDDRQAVAVLDQCDLVVHRRLLKHGQGNTCGKWDQIRTFDRIAGIANSLG